MSFGDHLEELRRRIIYALIPPLPLMIVTFFFSTAIIELLLAPLFRVLTFHDLPAQVQVLSPQEFLLARLKLSIILALVMTAPWILWQAWRFISPGLYLHEKRFVRFLIPGSAILTASGVALLYFAMLPLLLHVLVMFGATMREPAVLVQGEAPVDAVEVEAPLSMIETTFDAPAAPQPGQMWIMLPQNLLQIAVPQPDEPGRLQILSLALGPASPLVQQFRLSEYITFVLVLLVGIVIAFQMPLVIVLLGWLGLASADWLRANRRYALLACAVMAAVITPADAVSMLIMLIPLYALYELGILLLVIAPARSVAGGTVLRREEQNGPDQPGGRR